jgi:hypothetical protein
MHFLALQSLRFARRKEARSYWAVNCHPGMRRPLRRPGACPLEHYALAKERQHQVLDQLAVNHYLAGTQADASFRQSLALNRP